MKDTDLSATTLGQIGVASVVKNCANKNMQIGLWWEIWERLKVVKIKAFCLLFV